MSDPLGHDVSVADIILPGGFASTVVRIGDTVRRTQPGNAAFIHRLLDFFAERGWDGAPRFLGTDEVGRQVLSYIDGHAAWEPEQLPGVRL